MDPLGFNYYFCLFAFYCFDNNLWKITTESWAHLGQSRLNTLTCLFCELDITFAVIMKTLKIFSLWRSHSLYICSFSLSHSFTAFFYYSIPFNNKYASGKCYFCTISHSFFVILYSVLWLHIYYKLCQYFQVY